MKGRDKLWEACFLYDTFDYCCISTHLPWKEPQLLLCSQSKPKSADSAQPHWRHPGSLQVMIEFGPCCSLLVLFQKAPRNQDKRWAKLLNPNCWTRPYKTSKEKKKLIEKQKMAEYHMNQLPLLHMCPSEVHTKRPGRWMCCANCESQHNFHLEINKKRLSGSFFFFSFPAVLGKHFHPWQGGILSTVELTYWQFG